MINPNSNPKANEANMNQRNCSINIFEYQQIKDNKSLATQRATKSIEDLIRFLTNADVNNR